MLAATEPGNDADALVRGRSHGMDGLREYLAAILAQGLAPGRLRGVLHIAIGRRISRADGTVLSMGVTWRQLATELKNLRFDKELVREVGGDPESLSPRDRERMWYSAIALARPDTAAARAEAESLVPELTRLGFVIGADPLGTVPPAPAPRRKPGKTE
jgi:hypothetical protein